MTHDCSRVSSPEPFLSAELGRQAPTWQTLERSPTLVEPSDVLLEPWIYCCAWKANARFESSSIFKHFATSPIRGLSQCIPPRLGRCVPVHALNAPQASGVVLHSEIVPSEPPSWSRLMRKVQPSSKSSWLQIARPTWERLFKTSGLIAFYSLGMASDRGSAFKTATRLPWQRGSGCVTSAMRFTTF